MTTGAVLARWPRPARRHSVLPGFSLTLGFTVLWLSLIVLLPLSTLFLQTASLGHEELWAVVSSPRAVASYRLTFGASFAAAIVNGIFGLVVAWVLVRYPFPGRRLVDALVDLPFALPTAVAGIALTTLYAETGWLGKPLLGIGLRAAFNPLGVTLSNAARAILGSR